MNAPVRKKASYPSPAQLIPEQFRYVFEHRPVLWCENHENYSRLLADFIAEFKPETVVEYHLVKNLIDTQWEINRCQRLKNAAVEAEMPAATHDYLSADYMRLARDLGLDGSRETLQRVVRLAIKGNECSKLKVDKLVEAASSTYDALLYKSHAAGLSTINYFANKLAQLEQRRDYIIKKLEDRRQMLSAMKRALIGDGTRHDIIEIDSAAVLNDGSQKS